MNCTSRDFMQTMLLAFALVIPATPVFAGIPIPPVFDFESGGVPDPQGWVSTDLSGRGDFAALYQGANVIQEDCVGNTSNGVWGFFDNFSVTNYACGGWPLQGAVPFEDVFGQVINNQIWSPALNYTGSPGDEIRLAFDVYEDLPQDNLVYFTWGVRFLVGGVWTSWYPGGEHVAEDYGAEKGLLHLWQTRTFIIDDTVVPGGIPVGTTDFQVALGVKDECPTLCGVLGTGACHSHAPLFDNVRLAIFTPGTEWTVAKEDLFQDNFPNDGTTTGTVSVDAPANSYAKVRIDSPNGFTPDATDGTKDAVYLFVKDIGAKMGTAIENSSSYPVVTTPSSPGWTTIRMLKQATSVYVADVKDNIYTPGDVVQFYFSAQDGGGTWTYWSEFTGETTSEATVQAKPMEMTCLPTAGRTILYVDGADGDDDQLFYDNFFTVTGIASSVDRYDVRVPRHPGSGLGGRVQSTSTQLIPSYDVILWSSGDVTGGTIGDGTAGTSDDYQVLYDFLDQHTGNPGLYIGGNDAPTALAQSTGAGAVALRSAYMQFTLLHGCHRVWGVPATPDVVGLLPGTIFQGPPLTAPGIAWSFNAAGGCPDDACFDVLQAAGVTTLEMTYENDGASGALVRNISMNSNSNPVHVQLAGFAYKRIANVPGFPYQPRPARSPAGEGLERHYVMQRILEDFGLIIPAPVGVGDTPAETANKLAQNYPNPFNPSTTIRYFIQRQGSVTLAIYDTAGRLVRTLVDRTQSPREAGYSIDWDGTSSAGERVASGVYFYRLITPGFTQTRKMVLLK